MQLPIRCNYPNKDVARDLMVSFTTGHASPQEEREFEDHCLSCQECTSTLAVILRLLLLPVDDEELSLLYTIGRKAARISRQSYRRKACRNHRAGGTGTESRRLGGGLRRPNRH